jgi:23S rRNA pseudouridine2605 synthase
MRLNKYIAQATGISRRAADEAIRQNRVTVNGEAPSSGQQVEDGDSVTLDGLAITTPVNTITIMLNKPAGYVCSRDGQGSRTVYDLLPPEYHALKTVGRLDKDSGGLILLTNDGQLAHELTHPSFVKTKVYEVVIDKPLQPLHRQMISDHGVSLEDGLSKFEVERLRDGDDTVWRVRMHEGRNRQIRRTFAALGYTVTRLHRIQFGSYSLGDLQSGQFKPV